MSECKLKYFSFISIYTNILIRYKVKYEICNRKLKLKGGVATGRISLEYKSFEDAQNHKNMFNGEWMFRLKKQREKVLSSAYQMYYGKVVKSIWNFEQPK